MRLLGILIGERLGLGCDLGSNLYSLLGDFLGGLRLVLFELLDVGSDVSNTFSKILKVTYCCGLY